MANTLDTEMSIIGARIRAARVAKNMSQAELADKANISLPHISDIELGKNKMFLASFIRIIEALGVSADEILRADVPVVNSMYQNEFGALLADCSPAEVEAIMSIAKTVKQNLRAKKTEY